MVNKNMESWKDLDNLVNDYRIALKEQNNNFSKKILTFLNTSPETLVGEFRNHPNAVLTSKSGADWFSLWAGGVKIDGDFYDHENVINRIEELLNDKK